MTGTGGPGVRLSGRRPAEGSETGRHGEGVSGIGRVGDSGREFAGRKGAAQNR